MPLAAVVTVCHEPLGAPGLFIPNATAVGAELPLLEHPGSGDQRGGHADAGLRQAATPTAGRGQVEHRGEQLAWRLFVGLDGRGHSERRVHVECVVGAHGERRGLLSGYPGEQCGQAGQAGQLVAAVPAGREVVLHERALGWVDRAQHVDAERDPGLRAFHRLRRR